MTTRKRDNHNPIPLDIYHFIRSQDVAAHCRNIGKLWDTLGMATIIDRSNCTIEDKHVAWQALIEYYPDMCSCPNYDDVQFDSVHDAINERIKYDKQAIKRFKLPESGVIYSYRLPDWYDDSEAFSTFEKAFIAFTEAYSQEEAPIVHFKRSILDDDSNIIYADFDHDGSLRRVDVCIDDELFEKWFPQIRGKKSKIGRLYFAFSELFFIDIPIPFKRGDILVATRNRIDEVFVFDRSLHDTPEQYDKCLKGIIADGGDMNGCGFFVNEAAVLHEDHTADYDSFEYFKGKLEGRERLLHFVSLYLTGKITLSDLLRMQCRIVAEQILSNRNFRIDGSDCDCYIPEPYLHETHRKLTHTR